MLASSHCTLHKRLLAGFLHKNGLTRININSRSADNIQDFKFSKVHQKKSRIQYLYTWTSTDNKRYQLFVPQRKNTVDLNISWRSKHLCIAILIRHYLFIFRLVRQIRGQIIEAGWFERTLPLKADVFYFIAETILKKLFSILPSNSP